MSSLSGWSLAAALPEDRREVGPRAVPAVPPGEGAGVWLAGRVASCARGRARGCAARGGLRHACLLVGWVKCRIGLLFCITSTGWPPCGEKAACYHCRMSSNARPTSVESPLAAQAPTKLVIASRESRLAMWQAEYVRAALQKYYPACDVSILA